MTPPEDLVVQFDPQRSRYVLLDGGHELGFAEAHDQQDGTVLFPHTVIAPAHRGRGLGDVLVDRALDHAEARILERGGRGLGDIRATCWFVAEHLERRAAD